MDPVQEHDYDLTPRSVTHRMAVIGIQVESRNRNYVCQNCPPPRAVSAHLPYCIEVERGSLIVTVTKQWTGGSGD